MLVGLLLSLINAVTGQAGLELVGAVVIYQALVIYFKGNSLGKEVFQLYVASSGKYPKTKMFAREILLWFLFPLVILTLPFGASPLHDRLSNVKVVGYV